jgi:putative membrane protein
VAAVFGVLLAIGLSAGAGISGIADALGDLSWLGLVWLCVLQVLSLLLCAAAWWVIADGASFSACVTARWVRDGASNLVSIIPGVGELAGARALRLFGADASAAAASTVVDVSTESLSQAIYTLLGIIPLLGFVEGSETTRWLAALAVAVVPVLAVYAVTRHRGALRLVENIIVSVAGLVGLAEAVSELDVAKNVHRLYADNRRVSLAVLLHLAAWFMGAVQVWAAAQAMSIELAPGAALALESLVYAARGAFFMVPLGAGIQEASFILVGTIVGISPAAAIALSFALRARDVLLGAPAVLLWSAVEGRRTWLTAMTAGRK